GSIPLRGAAHCAAKRSASRKVPGVQSPLPLPLPPPLLLLLLLPPPPPPPPQLPRPQSATRTTARTMKVNAGCAVVMSALLSNSVGRAGGDCIRASSNLHVCVPRERPVAPRRL